MSEERPLSAVERALLDTLLVPDFLGAEALRQQAKALLARPGCSCGCGTVDLLAQGDPPRSSAAGPAPYEGLVRDAAGAEVGGVLLFIRDGLLESLEVYSYGEPLPLPHIVDVEVVRQAVPTAGP